MTVTASFVAAATPPNPDAPARAGGGRLGLLIRLAICLAVWSACYAAGRYLPATLLGGAVVIAALVISQIAGLRRPLAANS